MGIYDRDYYRDGERSYLNALLPEGRVCKALIALHAVFFVAAMVWAAELLPLSLQPEAFVHGSVWQLVTFSFMHPWAGLWSFALSMFFLWWFGSDLEQMYGSAEFLLFYLLAATLGGLAFVGAAYALHTESFAVTFGHSGSITAILVLFACHFPTHRVRIPILGLPVPIGLIVVAQIVGSLALDPEVLHGGFVTTLVGAIFAGLYYKKQWRLSGFLQAFENVRKRPRPKLRVFEPEDEVPEPVSVAAPKPQAPHLDEHLEAKVDEVLEKMARSGKESLTDTERQILLQASEIYRKKRT